MPPAEQMEKSTFILKILLKENVSMCVYCFTYVSAVLLCPGGVVILQVLRSVVEHAFRGQHVHGSQATGDLSR